MTGISVTHRPGYSERLWPNWRGLGLAVVFIASVGIAVGAVNLTAGVITCVVTTIAMAIALYLYAAVVRVDDDRLIAGRASIPVEFTGTVTILGPAEVKTQLGPGSDARTYAVLRSKIRNAVLVEITDPQDPTPCWLISTRRPTLLEHALTTAQSAHSVQTGNPSRS